MQPSCCRCHYSDADLEGLNLLFLNEDDDETTVMPRAGWEMFSCFTKVTPLSPLPSGPLPLPQGARLVERSCLLLRAA